MNTQFAESLQESNFGSIVGGAYVEAAQDGANKGRQGIKDAGDQIVAIATNALKKASKEFFHASLEESGGFILTHAPGHLAGMFDGDFVKDADGNYSTVNLMAPGNKISYHIENDGKKLSDFVSAPANKVTLRFAWGKPYIATGDVAKAFLRRFGNETSDAKLPSE